MRPNPSTTYGERLAWRRDEVRRYASASRRMSLARLGVFLVILATAWLTLARRGHGVLWLLVPLAGFMVLVIWHGRLESHRTDAARAVAFYERGIARLEHRWIGKGFDGSQFADSDHLYCDDLNLFGPGSLFQLLCVARTTGGRRRLAEWLLVPASPEEIVARQAAVSELAGRLDLREQIALAGPDLAGGLDADRLTAWAAQPRSRLPEATGLFATVLAAANVGALAIVLAETGPPLLFLASLIASGVFWARVRVSVHEVLRAVNAPAGELIVLQAMINVLENESFESPRLASLRDGLAVDGVFASRRIDSLRSLLILRDSQRNILFAPIAALLLLPALLALRVEHWRQECGTSLGRWLDAVADLEAIASLASYAAEHPSDAWPELTSGSPSFEAIGLAHPLLPPGTVVRNDVLLGPDCALLLISGSNMSGKTTLLRATGLAVVLAQAGAPAPATRLRLSPLAVAANIQTRDSVLSNRSRFYSEIERVRRMVSLAGDPERTLLFMLDELLSGTNSHDRRIGAEAIVRALLERGAVGLVTTHDLALTVIAATMGPPVVNAHFEDQLDNGQLRFDYRLRPGVVTRSNALALMRAVGLNVQEPQV